MKAVFKFFCRLLLLVFIGSHAMPALAQEETGRAKISWDNWGVPHVESQTRAGVFYGFGYAQMKSHGNLLLKLYGQSRGRAAEYFGKDYKDSDKKTWLMGVPDRAQEWYEKQTPEFKFYLDAFADGLNAYAMKHPEAIEEVYRQVLPVKGADVIAHAYRIIYWRYLISPELSAKKNTSLPSGSNAWAIAPSYSASGHAMLLANPHTVWGDESLIYEAHLQAPEVNLYGGTFVGFPVLIIAFNDFLGWTHTVNYQDNADLYEIKKTRHGYWYENRERTFEAHRQAIRIRQYDPSDFRKKFGRGPFKKLVEQITSSRGLFSPYRKTKFWIKKSIHGPVFIENRKKAYALRFAGMDRAGMLQAWWQMGTSGNFSEFDAAVKMQQLPVFSVISAGREGHIAHYFGGMSPKRPAGNWDWAKTVPGDGPETLWTETHPFQDLPKALDPVSGWLQNANDSPWSTTIPAVFDQANFPEYMAPWRVSLRAQRSIKMLMENPKMSLEQMIEAKHSTRMELADRLLDDLIPAAKQNGSPIARRAAAVLEAWDREAEAESRGAVLFNEFIRILGTKKNARCGFFRVCPDEKDFLKTPDGFSNGKQALISLEVAAREVELEYGSLDVSWGKIYRLRQNGKDLPANGGPSSLGIFRAVEFVKDRDRKFRAAAGDSFVMAVEFSNPPRAKALAAYGNATSVQSYFFNESLDLFSKKELRPVWRSPEEIQAHLKEMEIV